MFSGMDPMLKRKRLTALSGIAIALGAVAALIWVKLRIVSSVPRQVYAEPKDNLPQTVAPQTVAPQHDAAASADQTRGDSPR